MNKSQKSKGKYLVKNRKQLMGSGDFGKFRFAYFNPVQYITPFNMGYIYYRRID